MTNKSLPTEERTAELLELLPEDLKAQVLEGELVVYEGQKPEKPVVLNLKGQLVKGSGRWPNANDPAAVGKSSGYKRSKDYHEAMRLLIPIDGDADRRGSFAWLVEQGFAAAEGSPQKIKCPECGYGGIHVYKKDSNAIIKLIEMVHGRATETKDINLTSNEWIQTLSERFSVTELTVHDVTDEEVRRREVLLESDND